MTVDEDRHERGAIQAVVSRVADAVGPGVPREQVSKVVDAHYRRFDGSRVRTYVPLLVEHGVRDELRSWGHAAG